MAPRLKGKRVFINEGFGLALSSPTAKTQRREGECLRVRKSIAYIKFDDAPEVETAIVATHVFPIRRPEADPPGPAGAAAADGENSAGDAQELLDRAAELQTKFWEALRLLEEETGLDIESTRDLAGLTVEDLEKDEEL